MNKKAPIKIIVCPDSFKGSLSSLEVTEFIVSNLKSIFAALYPQNSFLIKGIPLADGGEGTSETLKNKFPIKIDLLASNPVGEKINTYYLLDTSEKTAFIESASILGLDLIDNSKRNPYFTTSYGLGEIVKTLSEKDVKDIYISLGGTATCDGGTGFLEALGIKFYDEKNIALNANGYNLQHIKKIAGMIPDKIKSVRFHVLSDVTSPLTGPTGASLMFSKQKGADNEQMIILEKGMINFSRQSELLGYARQQTARKEGSGAAGGLGFALYSYLKADYLSGIDFILENLNFSQEIKDASLIITGEGKIDRQSLNGKVLSGILKQNQNHNIPIISIGGLVEDKKEVTKSGVREVFSIADPNRTLEDNMRKEITLKNLDKTLKTIFQGNKYFN